MSASLEMANASRAGHAGETRGNEMEGLNRPMLVYR